MGINIQNPEETSDRPSKPESGFLHFRDEELSPPDSDSRTTTPVSTPKTTTSDGRASKTTTKRKALKAVIIAPIGFFIPFVLAVMLTVNHNVSPRTCLATETYYERMSQITASSTQGITGAMSRFAVSCLHAVTPILILLIGFTALCWALQLSVFAHIALKRRRIEIAGLTAHQNFIGFVMPMMLVILLQHIDFIPVFRGCELPALTTSWFPWIPDSWFRTGMSWILFIASISMFSIFASAFPGKGPYLEDKDLI